MADNFALEIEEDDELEGIIQLVGFNIANEKFGVNILMVQEIIRSAKVTNVPNSPDFVEGVINLHGNIIPVIDLRKRLNLYDEKSERKQIWILILSINNSNVGFIVDRVTEVIQVEEESVEQAPEIIVAGLESQYIQGVCDVAGNLIILLDFDLVLFNEEQKALYELNDEELVLGEDSMIS